MIFGVALSGCPADGPPHGAELGAVSVSLDADHPSVIHATFTTRDVVATWVRYGEPGFPTRDSPPDGAGTHHAHELLGNPYGSRVSARAVARLPDGTEVVGREVSIDVPPPPPEIPSFEVVRSSPASEVAGGYVAMVFQIGADDSSPQFVGILDGRARWVWLHAVTVGFGSSSVAPSLGREALVWPEYPSDREDAGGTIVEMALDGEVLSTTGAPALHHAITELPGDRYAYLSRQFLPAYEGSGAEWFMTDTIRIVPRGDDGTGATELFSLADDWLGADLAGYWLPPCDWRYDRVFDYENVCELTHTNSLGYLPERNLVFAYPRLLDTLLAIDADSGALAWQLGGLYSDYTAPNGAVVYKSPEESLLWSKGHFSEIWDGGLALFDNGVEYDPPHSSLAEYVWDESARTVAESWRYADPDGGYTTSLGDARRLPSGAVLGSWMSIGKLTEVARDGTVLWEVHTGKAMVRRVFFLSDPHDLHSGEVH